MKTNEQIACNNWEKIGFLKGKQSAEKEEIEFLENEVWHLGNQPEEIKITIENIKKRLEELKQAEKKE